MMTLPRDVIICRRWALEPAGAGPCCCPPCGVAGDRAWTQAIQAWPLQGKRGHLRCQQGLAVAALVISLLLRPPGAVLESETLNH